MDTDSDGQISVAELIAWVKKNSEQVCKTKLMSSDACDVLLAQIVPLKGSVMSAMADANNSTYVHANMRCSWLLPPSIDMSRNFVRMPRTSSISSTRGEKRREGLMTKSSSRAFVL